MKTVLSRLRQYGLIAKPTKCEWGAASLTYLGHQVRQGVVSVLECIVEAIRHYRMPVSKKDLQAFLGTTGYYLKFISHYADHSVLPMEATGKPAPFKLAWTGGMESCIFAMFYAICP